MRPFILNRTDERSTRSVGRIVLYALLFFVVTRLGAAIVVGIVQSVYLLGWGVNALELLHFLGTPEVVAEQEGWRGLFSVLLFAPLFEESAFRLGLSFRRSHAAVGLGALAAFYVACVLQLVDVPHPIGWALLPGAAVAGVLWFATSDTFWMAKRDRWQRPMMWASAILFGLSHLFAMSGLTWALLPMALAMACMLALSGCVMVYLRVNLGFWWGVGAHAFINLIGAISLLRILLG